MDASVDDIADLLVEDDHSTEHPVGADGEASEESLDVVLETPSPVLANPFMPPPPTPADEAADDNEGRDDSGQANLAYEDLLAKLVLPAKAPEPDPEPEMPAVMSSLPEPEPLTAPPLMPPGLAPPDAPNLQIAPPADERTLVTENPLVAEEQEAAVREGRSVTRDPLFPLPATVPIQGELRSFSTAPVSVPVTAGRSRLFYLVSGGLLVLGGMLIAVILLKVVLPSPAPPSPPASVVAPTPPLPPPPSAPPAHVEPLPPSAPAAAAATAEPPQPTEATADAVPVPETEPAAAKTHKVAHPKTVRPAAPKPAAVPKATTPKVAATPVAAPKATKPAPAKKSKTSGYADPFDN